MPNSVRRLDLFVTEQCNLSCSYCYARSGSTAVASSEELARRIDWLMKSSARRLHVTFWGGEPLLFVDRIQEAVVHARAQARRYGKRVTFGVPTNATLLTREWLAWSAGHGVALSLSIDGDQQAQALRPLRSGGGSHFSVDKGLALVRAMSDGLSWSVRMTVAPEQARRIPENVSYFMSRGVSDLGVYPAYDQEWPSSAIECYAAGQRQVAEILIDRVLSGGKLSQIPRFRLWQPILRRLAQGRRRPRSGLYARCGAGHRLLAVTVTGSLVACHRVPFYQRRVRDDQSLGTCETGVQASERGRRWCLLDVAEVTAAKPCTSCDLFDLCPHSCPAINYAGTGETARVPVSVCALVRADVEVCRAIHERLRSLHRFHRYLGDRSGRRLDEMAALLGERAWDLYHKAAREELG